MYSIEVPRDTSTNENVLAAAAVQVAFVRWGIYPRIGGVIRRPSLHKGGLQGGEDLAIEQQLVFAGGTYPKTSIETI